MAMRSAQYITTIPMDALERIIDTLELRSLIEQEDHPDSLLDLLLEGNDAMMRCVGPILLPGGHWERASYGDLGMWSCMAAPPHTDGAFHDYTAGLVLRGDHVLFTGRGRKACDLKPGVVYLLHNKTMLGARPSPGNTHQPLVFIALDFRADSMKDALNKVNATQKLEK